MFSLDDEDTSQSEIDSIGIISVNCENEEKMYRNKSEVYRRLECNMNIFKTNPTDACAVFESTSRFDNLILNGSVSVPTSSFACNSKCIEEVSTIKIVNSPPVEESPNELEMTNLTGSERPMKASTDDSFSNPRKRRFVMAVTVASVVGVTIVIVIIVLLTFSLHR
ncbi:hypothetical protein GHT06_013264 [Daphnia sinensis]|uniref:Uncharacterized protein n=1 Tax=Daphnia sinensis TaxID=1820382 RepID=A0AAD5KZ59_9CRUS|nr:hypothetical protein GHT06_013264 [Daphnia sinensis]